MKKSFHLFFFVILQFFFYRNVWALNQENATEPAPVVLEGEIIPPRALSLEESLQKSPTAEDVAEPSNHTGTQAVDQDEPEPVAALKAESEIPLKANKLIKSAEPEPFYAKLLISLAIVATVVLGGFFALKKYSLKMNKQQSEKKIKILTQHYLGPKKSLAIVRVAGETILIGLTDHNISMLKSLSLVGEDEEELTENSVSPVFAKVFSRSIKSQEAVKAVENENEREDFLLSSVKDSVKLKLKGLRSFE